MTTKGKNVRFICKAEVYGNAQVFDNAQVYGKSNINMGVDICGKARLKNIKI